MKSTLAKPATPITELIWATYLHLAKQEQEKLAKQIFFQMDWEEDEWDHLLIEKSRQEKGKNIVIQRKNAY
jgi:hypothetical protein